MDRQPPVIRIAPPGGTCVTEEAFNLGYVVEDAVDPTPTHGITHRDFGCARLFVIEASDDTGHHTAAHNALVNDARITWSALEAV